MTDGFIYDDLETIWSDSLSESLSSRVAINSFCGSRQRTVVACNSCSKSCKVFEVFVLCEQCMQLQIFVI